MEFPKQFLKGTRVTSSLSSRKLQSSARIKKKILANPSILRTLSPTGEPRLSEPSWLSSVPSEEQSFRRKSFANISADFSAFYHGNPFQIGNKLTVQQLSNEHRKIALNDSGKEDLPVKDLKFLMKLKGKLAEMEKLRVQCFSLNLPIMNDIAFTMQALESCMEFSDWNTDTGRLAVITHIIEVEAKMILMMKELHGRMSDKSLKNRCLLKELAETRKKTLRSNQNPKEKPPLKDKLEKIKKSKASIENQYHSQARKWNLEREKLNSQIEQLEEKLACLKSTTSSQEDSSKYKELYEKTQQASMKLLTKQESQIYSLQLTLGTVREELQKKKNFLNSFRQTEAKLTKGIQDNNKYTSSLQTLAIKQREIILMQEEDMLRYYMTKDILEKTATELADCKTRYNQIELNIQVGSIPITDDPGLIIINYNDPVFDKIQNPSHYKHSPSTLTALKPLPSLDPTADKLDLSRINLAAFKYARPAFVDFLSINRESEVHELPFHNWLEVTIRGIYDSKYYEILMCNEASGRYPSRFPEFIYSWLGYYFVDDNRRVAGLPSWKREYANEARVNFLTALSHSNAKQVWELQTFRDFLMEEMGVDELAFFLHCRVLLFQGTQLGTSPGQLSAIHYVPLQDAFDVVEKIMDKMYENDRKELKLMILKKAKKIKTGMTIDAAYVLRLLLEYYKIEKKSKYIAIQTLFNIYKISVRPYLDFVGFKNICEGLDDTINSMELATFYRDVWSASKGKIDSEAIFLVANENCFFYKLLRLKKHWDSPSLNPKGEINENRGIYHQLMQGVHSHFTKLTSSVNLVNAVIKSMGVPQLLFTTEKLEGYIRRKGQNKIEEYNGWNLLFAYRHYWNLITTVGLSYEEFNYSLEIENSELKVAKEIKEVPGACGSLIAKVKQQEAKAFAQVRAIKKIQNLWKSKAYTSMNVLGTIFKGVNKFKGLISNRHK